VSLPIAVDLCCGKGGWTIGLQAAGFRVIGIDVEHYHDYPGEFRRGDVLSIDPSAYVGAALVVASPPCEEFSRHQMPWTRRRNPPAPNLDIVLACYSFAERLGAPIVLENVRAAQKWLGKAAWHCGSYYLWGDVPALMPKVNHTLKESLSSTRRADRAMIPFDLALWIGKCFLPTASSVAMRLPPHAASTDAPIATAMDCER